MDSKNQTDVQPVIVFKLFTLMAPPNTLSVKEQPRN